MTEAFIVRRAEQSPDIVHVGSRNQLNLGAILDFRQADFNLAHSEEIVVPYYYDGDKRYHRYFPDLKIVFEKQTLLVEIKPDKETKPPTGSKRTKRYINEAFTYVKNMNKWEAANEYAKDRGWEFQVWTENTLQTMGIMPKPIKKLKPLPAPKKKKK